MGSDELALLVSQPYLVNPHGSSKFGELTLMAMANWFNQWTNPRTGESYGGTLGQE